MSDGPEHLRTTQAYLASMEAGLADLLDKIPDDESARRKILSQPYQDEIERVRAELKLATNGRP